MGMTMATPVIALGSLQWPGPARQIVRTVEVGETFQHGGDDPPLQPDYHVENRRMETRARLELAAD
jgi:hypothetical protein